MSTPKRPFYQDVEGFRIPGFFSADAYSSAIRYKPRSDDFFIVTFPKCGTTWVQNIIGCIYREGKSFESAMEFLTMTPFLEMTGADAARTMKRPGAIKLHLPFRLTPWSAEAKYVYVARNPKDCCVSFYHHTENIVGYKFTGGSFDDYFELFMNGETDFGEYYDTTLSWYEHRNDPNVLFITYEQLKKDTRGYVLKLAEFMGQEYKEQLENDKKMLKDVIHHSSFNFLKETLNTYFEELYKLPAEFVQNHPDIPSGIKEMLGTGDVFSSEGKKLHFVRKGIIGDWRNHFSPEQNRRMNEKFEDKMKGTDLYNLWKDDML